MHLNRTAVLTAIMLLVVAIPAYSQGTLAARPQTVLDGEIATLSVDLAGGSIVDFHLDSRGLNPLSWNFPADKAELTPRKMGHFICFDRWGQPTKSELENGMPFHGEATAVTWSILSQPAQERGMMSVAVGCDLPIAGLTLERTISMGTRSAVASITEVITNVNPLGRVYNIIQHSTIAPPFLDETTIVDTDVAHGLMQESPYDGPIIYWPKIAYRDRLVDLSRLTDDASPGVVSFVFEDDREWGWTTACTPAKGLLIGYLWRVEDYPWMNFWRNVADGKPAARGLEFGTTGLHRPFTETLQTVELHGKRLFEYIDAGESVTKSYYMFLAEIPTNWTGTAEVSLSGTMIHIAEAGEDGRMLMLDIK